VPGERPGAAGVQQAGRSANSLASRIRRDIVGSGLDGLLAAESDGRFVQQIESGAGQVVTARAGKVLGIVVREGVQHGLGAPKLRGLLKVHALLLLNQAPPCRESAGNAAGRCSDSSSWVVQLALPL